MVQAIVNYYLAHTRVREAQQRAEHVRRYYFALRLRRAIHRHRPDPYADHIAPAPQLARQ